ncbi:hypothetical protein OSCI_3570014 [Kamptonema sp. PCC 6506]|nr:hypothetical protein OSCI_3570014 [Kamptonema sp. PCC 6506]
MKFVWKNNPSRDGAFVVLTCYSLDFRAKLHVEYRNLIA